MQHYKENFNGEVVVITGASRGIGAQLARDFAKAGAKVACLATSKDKIDALAEEIKANGGEAISIKCNVKEYSELEAAYAEVEKAFGGMDIVIVNAGINAKEFKLIGEDDIAEWKDIIDVNLKGAYNTTRAAVPYLKKRGGGKIIALGFRKRR